MPIPLLEYDMWFDMEAYMSEMIEAHKTEINGLILIQRQFKKGGKIKDAEQVKTRINKLTGLENKARNFVLFIKDYMKTAYGKE